MLPGQYLGRATSTGDLMTHRILTQLGGGVRPSVISRSVVSVRHLGKRAHGSQPIERNTDFFPAEYVKKQAYNE
eukprot:12140943-Ditylum_brightwellii.AAC.2